MKDYSSSELLKTFNAVNTEFAALQIQKLKPAEKMERYNHFDFSPSTRQQLLKVFGTEKPFKLQALSRADGKVDLEFALDPLDYRDDVIGATVKWAPMNGLSTFDKTFRHAEVSAFMPWVKFEHQDGWNLIMDKLNLQGTQHLNVHDLWLGKVEFNVASVNVQDVSAANLAAINNIKLNVEMSQHGKMADVTYAVSSQSAKFGDTELGPMRFAFRLNNLSEQGFAAMQKSLRNVVTSGMPEKEQDKAVLALITKDGKKVLTTATSLDIEEISVVYHDFKAAIHGKLWLDHAKPGDMLSFDKWKNKLALHVDVEMPMGFAEEVARFFSRRSLQQKLESGQTVSEDAVNQSADVMVTQTVENLRAQKMIRVDNGMLRSSLDYSAGKFRVNGNPINMNLPKFNAGDAKTGK